MFKWKLILSVCVLFTCSSECWSIELDASDIEQQAKCNGDAGVCLVQSLVENVNTISESAKPKSSVKERALVQGSQWKKKDPFGEFPESNNDGSTPSSALGLSGLNFGSLAKNSYNPPGSTSLGAPSSSGFSLGKKNPESISPIRIPTSETPSWNSVAESGEKAEEQISSYTKSKGSLKDKLANAIDKVMNPEGSDASKSDSKKSVGEQVNDASQYPMGPMMRNDQVSNREASAMTKEALTGEPSEDKVFKFNRALGSNPNAVVKEIEKDHSLPNVQKLRDYDIFNGVDIRRPPLDELFKRLKPDAGGLDDSRLVDPRGADDDHKDTPTLQ